MAVLLAAALSSIAAAVVVGLDAMAVAPRPILVVSVILIGFVASWVQTGRVERSAGSGSRQPSVAAIPVRP